MLSEGQQTENTVLFVLYNSIYMKMIKRSKPTKVEDSSVAAGSLGRKWEKDHKRAHGNIWVVEIRLNWAGWWLYSSVSLLELTDLHTCIDNFYGIQFSSVAQSCPTLWNPMNCMQHTGPPCPSPTPGVHPNPCPLSRWCHPTISSSVVPFSFCPQSFPASGSFPMSQLFTSGGQSIGVSASTSALPMNTQDWFTLGWTGWISLQSKGLSRVFSNTTVQKHQFFGAQLSL